MTAEERRKAIGELLASISMPISATALAGKFFVSRQVIVGDIALLRAGGTDISATPRGYVITKREEGIIRTVACVHSADAMCDELYAIVDNGCTVLDVVVEHPIYGQLTGQLQLSNRYDVDKFAEKLSHQVPPLSALTGGIHLHTLRCPDEAAYQRVLGILREKSILLIEST